ncbi:MAG: S-layer homology domain-containing protein [Oscillospiraceae bacterium]|nr:S-layer homology domain-containing protein [Oscillospiraceae bacterium]
MKKLISAIIAASLAIGMIPAGVASASEAEPPALTVYTAEMRENARRNIEKYDWAKEIRDKAVEAADKHVENLDVLYERMPGEGIPRSYTITTLQSPAEITYVCPYCKTNIQKTHGAYAWKVDLINHPWKVQCPECERRFPSNDFEGFYKLGLLPDGTFDVALAHKKNQELVDKGEQGYLVNILYPDVEKELGIPADKVSTWLVDDGFGWSVDDMTYGTKSLPKYAPLAYYMHQMWGVNGMARSTYTLAISELADAYLYTGDKKYGIAGLILLDRVADLYPGYDLTKVSLNYANSHGGGYSGKTVGSIWEPGVANELIYAYDAFKPILGEAEVIEYLSEKAKGFGLSNTKTSAELIRKNIEDNVLRETFKGAKSADLRGNFGMHQLSVALAAVALDSEPETSEMFDWLGRASNGYPTEKIVDPIYGREFDSFCETTGGDMLTKYVNDVDRDGFGNEVGIGYNRIWVVNGLSVAEVLYRYGYDGDLNLFANPKYKKMFNSIIKETVGHGYSLHIGDSGSTANKALYSTADEALHAFYMLRDPVLAQNYYYSVGGNLDDVYIDIFSNNDSLKADIQAAIDTYGELEFESENLTGFGLGILRDDMGSGNDVWMNYGISNTSHAHQDILQLGINAYGFNFTPDLGYPEATGFDPNRYQWVMNTLSHNAVTVNEEWQKGIPGGTPLHFDDSGKVKVMDVEAPEVYDAVSEYRRTAVYVDTTDGAGYTVDFFRVKGGDQHTYSFHTQSHKGYTTEDFTLIPQVDENGAFVGTYAGKNVPYGEDPNSDNTHADYTLKYPRGYTWLTDVNRAEGLEDGTFAVNFEQTDFNDSPVDAEGLNLKFRALNDWTPSEVALMKGYAPRTSSNKNIPGLDYMLIHRKGKDLDTLFTSVIEPYKGEGYIADAEIVPVVKKDGPAAKFDVAKAIKITLVDGRTDYIVYATNNAVTYNVDEKFDFRGFVGVYSENALGENIYSYINDGVLIGETNGDGAYTGSVVSFTDKLSSENEIEVSFEGAVDTELLSGKYIYIDNEGDQNGVYRIHSAKQVGKNVTLNIGDVSVIRKYKDNFNLDAGFVYNISKGDKFRIPLPTVYDNGAKMTDNITRAEFVKALVEGLEIEETPDNNFSDVLPSADYARAVSVAKKLGIVNGIGNDKFAPDSFITRQDMMVMVYRALKVTGKELATDSSAGVSATSFSDYNLVSDYAKEAVSYLVANGIIKGTSDGRIAPKAFVTIWEADAVIERIK